MDASDDILLAALNRSGFPYQARVEAALEGTGWQLLAREHPCLVNGEVRFVDSVLIQGTTRLVVETKRWDGEWIFSVAPDEAETIDARALRTQPEPRGSIWGQATMSPPSPESSFCVIYRPDKGDRDRPPNIDGLEKIAQELVRASEAIAKRETEIHQIRDAWPVRYYAPVIVTTARLMLGQYDPSKVDLETGRLTKGDVAFRQATFLRFTKAFTESPLRLGSSLADVSDDLQRTIWVVNSSGLVKFLKTFGLASRA